jgi:hypothetical protein
MAYSEFTLTEVTHRFELDIDESQDLFAAVPSLTPSSWLQTVLTEDAPLALAVQTEKVRSELLISPILMELRRQIPERIGVFSGVEFNVDPERGLVGFCDFILSLSPEQWLLQAPVLAVVEAKNENLRSGMGQCIAEMVAAQLFNERAGKPLRSVYGAVTTGDIWKFLRLDHKTVFVDKPVYYIESIERILGILYSLFQR